MCTLGTVVIYGFCCCSLDWDFVSVVGISVFHVVGAFSPAVWWISFLLYSKFHCSAYIIPTGTSSWSSGDAPSPLPSAGGCLSRSLPIHFPACTSWYRFGFLFYKLSCVVNPMFVSYCLLCRRMVAEVHSPSSQVRGSVTGWLKSVAFASKLPELEFWPTGAAVWGSNCSLFLRPVPSVRQNGSNACHLGAVNWSRWSIRNPQHNI